MMLYLGLLAGFLQLVGYLLYVRNEEIEPNPVTWLMFAYGTMLLTFLEWDRAGDGRGAAAARSSAAAWRSSWRRAAGGARAGADPRGWWPREWWPDDWRDRASFQADLALTGALPRRRPLLTYSRWIGEGARNVAVMVFLIGANLTTFTAFFPLIRGVVEDPSHERTAPWAVWATAYALLGVTTFAIQGRSGRS